MSQDIKWWKDFRADFPVSRYERSILLLLPNWEFVQLAYATVESVSSSCFFAEIAGLYDALGL